MLAAWRRCSTVPPAGRGAMGLRMARVVREARHLA
jgi:hypothetical protein